jgi:hypothetical protein
MKPRRMRWAGYVARMGEIRNACKILVGKHEKNIRNLERMYAVMPFRTVGRVTVDD